jgi:NADH-quinone oxidoreductase subunit N
VPDVYQGAPTPVTALLSVGSKASGFIVLTRVVEALLVKGSVIASPIIHLLLIMGGATILFGNLAAIAQTNFKRLLGYSSIAHAGFLVLALACRHSVNGFTPAEIAAFYLATYLPMTFICFLLLSAGRAQGLGEDISSFAGLARSHPVLGLSVTLALASLAGLPLTAGFIGKLLVVFSAAYDGSYLALSMAIIGAAVGFYYYFKVILSLYSEPAKEPLRVILAPLSKVMLAIFVAAIVVIGVYPNAVRAALKPGMAAVK